jgi:hypothetical protein
MQPALCCLFNALRAALFAEYNLSLPPEAALVATVILTFRACKFVMKRCFMNNSNALREVSMTTAAPGGHATSLLLENRKKERMKESKRERKKSFGSSYWKTQHTRLLHHHDHHHDHDHDLNPLTFS